MGSFEVLLWLKAAPYIPQSSKQQYITTHKSCIFSLGNPFPCIYLWVLERWVLIVAYLDHIWQPSIIKSCVAIISSAITTSNFNVLFLDYKRKMGKQHKRWKNNLNEFLGYKNFQTTARNKREWLRLQDYPFWEGPTSAVYPQAINSLSEFQGFLICLNPYRPLELTRTRSTCECSHF